MSNDVGLTFKSPPLVMCNVVLGLPCSGKCKLVTVSNPVPSICNVIIPASCGAEFGVILVILKGVVALPGGGGGAPPITFKVTLM